MVVQIVRPSLHTILFFSSFLGTAVARNEAKIQGNEPYLGKQNEIGNNVWSNRTACKPGDIWPPTRENTTKRLADVRQAMLKLNLDAFIVHSNDAHGYGSGNTQFVRFRPVTLVPFEPNLINYDLLDDKQFAWINSYHRLTRDTIRPLLTTDLAKAWLMSRTEQFTRPHLCSSTTILSSLSVPVTFSLTTTLSLTVILTGVSSMKKCADT